VKYPGKKIIEIARAAKVLIHSFQNEALNDYQRLLRHNPLFDTQLTLLDVMMPEMDGIAALGQLRKLSQTANTPVIFMTAKVQPDEIEQYISLDASGVIAKPFDPMELVAEIEQNRVNYHEQ